MKHKLLSLSLMALVLGAVPAAHAQAKYTATRILDLQAGGYFVADFPDYTRHKFYGYGAYVDLDFSNHFGVEGEFRRAADTSKYDYTSLGLGTGTVPQYQQTFEGGLRYFRHYHGGKYAPYVKGLYGYSSEEYPPFPPPAPQNVSAGTYNYQFIAAGAGLDYGITRHINLRADLEYQRWFAATNSPSPNNINGLPRGLTPILWSGGVAWRFGNRDPLP